MLPDGLDRLSAALAAIEPGTGYIRALVGGRDYYPECEPTEPATKHRERTFVASRRSTSRSGNYGGGSGRQPGSSFKPFVLAAALQRGISLHQQYASHDVHLPVHRSAPWKVSNYDGAGGGRLTLVDGTARSVNAVFARLEIDGVGDGRRVQGRDRVATVARRMGIGFPTPEELKSRCGDDYQKVDACIPADDTPAIALGAKEVSPARHGVGVCDVRERRLRASSRPRSCASTDAERPRALRRRSEPRPRHPGGVARGVTYALQEVVKRGTGTRAATRSSRRRQDRDVPAVARRVVRGYVPQLAAVVWVGNPIPQPRSGIESMIADQRLSRSASSAVAIPR